MALALNNLKRVDMPLNKETNLNIIIVCKKTKQNKKQKQKKKSNQKQQ